jgi:GNAT superfamily N-acetyltransferase
MTTTNADEPRVGLVENEEDLVQGFYSISEAFGRQCNDAIWTSVYPGWDTPAGQKEGAAKLIKRWKATKTNKFGDANTVFLKATVSIDEDGEKKEKIAGLAIWQQCSFVDGYGDPPINDLGDDIKTLEPAEQRFASQMFGSLWKRRIAYTREKQNADPPAIFVLDLCAVDPAYQGRGAAKKLVQWGLDEAKRRGNLECTTEASSMGRGVYMKMGFQPEGELKDMEFEVDEEFKDRKPPPNVFLRTWATQ